MNTQTASGFSVSFLGQQLTHGYDSDLDIRGKGFHLDVRQTFSGILTPENARLLLNDHAYGLNRDLDSKSTAVHTRDYGTIRIALRPNANGGFEIILVDGQHTCDIAARAGLDLPCTLQIFQCLDDNGIDNLFSTFDSGKTRYLGNAITHGFKTGSIPDHYPPSNILRLVPGAINWVREGFPKKMPVAATNSTSMALIKSDSEVQRFCDIMGNIINAAPVTPALQNKGAIAALFCIFRNNDLDTFVNFCNIYWHGSAGDFIPAADSPAAQLRTKMMGKLPRKTNEIDHLSWVYQAWKAHTKGIPRTQLQNKGQKTGKTEPWSPSDMEGLEW